MTGIICDINYSRHHLFLSYYHGIKNVLGEPKIISCKEDLKGIDTLFICDDHYDPHRVIWQSSGFIEACNDIRVVVLTNEKVINSYFKWNEDNYKLLRRFKNLYHFTNDVDDCLKLGTSLNRTAISESINVNVDTSKKYNKAVFIGNVICNSYSERREILKQVSRAIKTDLIKSVDSWGDYMQILAKYRFIFSPIGNGNFFPMRFYEALRVNSIPIHQVRGNTLKYYSDEAEMNDCVFFEDVSQIRERVDKLVYKRSFNSYTMEDNITNIWKQVVEF